jgi:hypothetical protein
MNTQFKTIYFILICLIYSVTAQSQSRQVANFKAIKKSIDTLIFLTPYVAIESISKSTHSKPDTSLESTLLKQLNKEIYSSLTDKHLVKKAVVKLVYNDGIDSLFNNLGSYDKQLPDINIPKWLNNYLNNISGKYILIAFLGGFYNADYPPYYLLKEDMKKDMLMVSFNTPTLYTTHLKIIIADKETNKIIYYNSILSKRIDPRIPAEIERLISDIIKPIYYR